ncbi:hypothetical protein C8Q80DRAFT_222736 [Daedaleopsis nitida]|nr:hypothetical protein C8Q80DRAFT_222736 [Daedaleopsis nitida]
MTMYIVRPETTSVHSWSTHALHQREDTNFTSYVTMNMGHFELGSRVQHVNNPAPKAQGPQSLSNWTDIYMTSSSFRVKSQEQSGSLAVREPYEVVMNKAKGCQKRKSLLTRYTTVSMGGKERKTALFLSGYVQKHGHGHLVGASLELLGKPSRLLVNIPCLPQPLVLAAREVEPLQPLS